MKPDLQFFWLIGALAAFTLLAAAARARRARRRSSQLAGPWPLKAKQTLLSVPEQVLFRRLMEALPGYIVFAQVQLLQILEFKRGRRSVGVLNRTSQLSIDFLITGPDTRIVAAIELDDSIHDRRDRRHADARKAHALDSAGVPLLRWTTRHLPDVQAIVTAVKEVTTGNTNLADGR